MGGRKKPRKKEEKREGGGNEVERGEEDQCEGKLLHHHCSLLSPVKGKQRRNGQIIMSKNGVDTQGTVVCGRNCHVEKEDESKLKEEGL